MPRGDNYTTAEKMEYWREQFRLRKIEFTKLKKEYDAYREELDAKGIARILDDAFRGMESDLLMMKSEGDKIKSEYSRLATKLAHEERIARERERIRQRDNTCGVTLRMISLSRKAHNDKLRLEEQRARDEARRREQEARDQEIKDRVRRAAYCETYGRGVFSGGVKLHLPTGVIEAEFASHDAWAGNDFYDKPEADPEVDELLKGFWLPYVHLKREPGCRKPGYRPRGSVHLYEEDDEDA